MACGWAALLGAAGTVVGIVGAGYAIRNHTDANKYRRLDRPWVTQSSGTIEATHRSVQVRVANDDKGIWEIVAARIASPGHARLAITGSYDDDGYGGAIPKPGDWKQNITLDRWNGTLHINVVKEPIRILFTLRARADPSQTLTSGLNISAPAS